ncbi:aminodeoxychorismate synthase, subunit I [Thermosyntropha lipolytica DSM 11003]|uniref:Anthranilate synthase component 1 n=1 Tax=Thermosyntropha lipolytica DSM 11003 TaxID=1123382 RepID=A0A1M5JPW9_9FIRM|nr:aminodeoxychorismate synthase component I [Thermosyntropha lipolytica]SHG42340.1 aminodeoxychorismate synthase, subunit I [Thermosyntropha lipolytica DSM 11003]
MYLRKLNLKCDLWSLYARLNRKNSFFLDSSLRDDDVGKYSFMGYDPVLMVRSRGDIIEYREGKSFKKVKGNPLSFVDKVLKANQDLRGQKSPFPFAGGIVGYFSYDLKNMIEKLPVKNIDDVGVYDQYWGVYDTFVVEDHRNKSLWLAGYDIEKLNRMEKELEEIAAIRNPFEEGAYIGEFKANFSREEYVKAIAKVRDYIRQGDIYQVNLSQRFKFEVKGSSRYIYDVIRRISPAPFAAFLSYEEFEVLSISPERFILIAGDYIETRPIKGTRPRGRNPEEDRMLREELACSIKDKAELLMIVDLERNDLGRISRPGTVRVPELFRIKDYATIFHLDSIVTGRLKPGITYEEILRATFPGGSITGAPKIRAMEIIEELEPVCRGVYTGSIGYIDYRGNCDLNIAIRTMVIKDGWGYYQAGGGLTIDSDPEMEYEETWHKTKSLVLTQKEVNRSACLV